MKLCLTLICLYLFLEITDVEKFFKYNGKSLYDHILSLEEAYDNKLLTAHGINSKELNSQCDNEKCRKEYIINKAKITEKEYQDIFNHPVAMLRNSKEKTEKSIKNTYDEFKEKIKTIYEIIEILSPD